jgi:hypothetical protein
MKWYFQVLRKYEVFAGRARRKEFWIVGLIHALIIFALRYPNLLTSDPESRLGQISGRFPRFEACGNHNTIAREMDGLLLTTALLERFAVEKGISRQFCDHC